MNLYLRCIKPVDFRAPGGDLWLSCEEGKSYRAILMPDGVRFSKDGKLFGLPYSPYELGKYFITDFDKESYDKIYWKVSNFKMYVDGKMFCEAPEAIVRME